MVMSNLAANTKDIRFQGDAASPERNSQLAMKQVVFLYGLGETSLTFFIGAGANLAYAYGFLGWSQALMSCLAAACVVSVGLVAGSVIREHHQDLEARSQVSATWTGLTASLRAFALLIAALFVLKISDDVSRGAIICQFVAVTATTMLSRAMFHRWVRRNIASGRLVTGRLLVLGDSMRIVNLIAERGFCERLRVEGKDIVRIAAWNTDGFSGPEPRFISDAIATCRANAVDSVVIVPNAEQAALAERVTASFSETPVTVHILPFAGLGDATPGATRIGGQASLAVANSPLSSIGKIGKRVIDIVVASAMLMALAPLLIVVAVAIKLDSPGPIFFRQNRHGYGNRHIRVFKFRSMIVMEDGNAFRQAKRNDSRITRVGRFIRRANLDELPQLLNVLLGDMSLVGPRPHPIALNEDFAGRIQLFHRRHNILPGITGWAQVNGYRGETDTEEKMRKRIDHDLWYIDNWSIGLDLRILILTLFSSVAYRNAG